MSNVETLRTRHTGRLVRLVVRQTERGLALFGLGVIVFHFGFDLSRMTSDSMRPTLQGTCWENGDRILTEKISYWFRRPRRWEVVTFRHEDGRQIMKRVVGLPGEHVQMLRGGRLVIDGQEIDVPASLDFLEYFPFGKLVDDQSVACGEGYFVLGDFSRDSDDSRFNGPVPSEAIIGRAWLIVGPAGRRGFVR